MTTTLKAYKFLIVPVLQQINEDGQVVAEAQPEQPDVVFGVDGLQRYADGFEDAVGAQNAKLNGQPVDA